MTKKTLFISTLVALTVTATLISCEHENEFVTSKGDMRKLGFVINTPDEDESSSTRSGEESFVVDTFVLGDDTLALVCHVTDMDDDPYFSSSAATRGEQITTSNFDENYGSYGMALSCYLDGDVSKPMFKRGADDKPVSPAVSFVDVTFKATTEDVSGGTGQKYWKTSAEGFYWWEEEKYRLFGWAPASAATGPLAWTGPGSSTYTDDGDMEEFEYTVPTGGTSGSYVNKDAEVQPDILVGSTDVLERDELETYTSGSESGYVIELKLYHALSSVRFKVGSTLGKDNITIQSIKLSGLSGSGKCTYEHEPATGDPYISWSDLSTAIASYTQKYERAITNTEAAALDAGTKTIPLYYDDEGEIGQKGRTFMLIPQTLTSAAKLTVNIKYTSGSVTFEKGLEHQLVGSGAVATTGGYSSYGKWEPGMHYTYTIDKVPGQPEVGLSDNVTATTKSNLEIKNTGLVLGYVRANIIGGWYDNSGNMVANWDPSDTDQGTFTNLATSASGWVKGDDGFYYFPYPLQPGHALNTTNGHQLFTSYTIKSGYCPVKDSHLEIQIMAQMMEYDKTIVSDPSKALVVKYWTSGGTSIGSSFWKTETDAI